MNAIFEFFFNCFHFLVELRLFKLLLSHLYFAVNQYFIPVSYSYLIINLFSIATFAITPIKLSVSVWLFLVSSRFVLAPCVRYNNNSSLLNEILVILR